MIRYLRRPLVRLTTEGVELPNCPTVRWDEIEDVVVWPLDLGRATIKLPALLLRDGSLARLEADGLAAARWMHLAPQTVEREILFALAHGTGGPKGMVRTIRAYRDRLAPG